MNTIEENGTIVGSWNNDFAIEFFSNPSSAGIAKIIIKNRHNFQISAWTSCLTNLQDITTSGVHDIILDLSLLPSVEDRTLRVSISGSFKNITNWYNTAATSLFFGHIELS